MYVYQVAHAVSLIYSYVPDLGLVRNLSTLYTGVIYALAFLTLCTGRFVSVLATNINHPRHNLGPPNIHASGGAGLPPIAFYLLERAPLLRSIH